MGKVNKSDRKAAAAILLGASSSAWNLTHQMRHAAETGSPSGVSTGRGLTREERLYLNNLADNTAQTAKRLAKLGHRLRKTS